MFDAQSEHRDDSFMQALYLTIRQAICTPQWMNLRIKQCFIGIDISDASNNSLIQ